MNQHEKTMRREVTWISGKTIIDKLTYFDSKQAYMNLNNEVKHLKGLSMTTNWFLYNDETGELLASKHPETPKSKAIRLYGELGNYAEVARQMDLHPTTIRTWCKEKAE